MFLGEQKCAWVMLTPVRAVEHSCLTTRGPHPLYNSHPGSVTSNLTMPKPSHFPCLVSASCWTTTYQVITDCLQVVEAILGEHPPMMKALAANASAREFVVTTLARNPAARLRLQMGQLLVGLRSMAGTLLRWLTGELEVSWRRWRYSEL